MLTMTNVDRYRGRAGRLLLALGFAVLATIGTAGQAAAGPTATITGAFGDNCRNFIAQSSKDISHVSAHYADGRIVKDEGITSPRHTIDGGIGDEITTAVVKSGRTIERFDCAGGNPPVALLETRRCTELGCEDWFSHDSDGSHEQCSDLHLPVRFRGINSTDPDGDIVSWTLSFDDGSSVEGSWTDSPPTEVSHLVNNEEGSRLEAGTLTVTDATGRTSSDPIVFCVVDLAPD